MTNTKLAAVKVGDEILAIGDNPAATVTVGIPWGDIPQRLIVTAVSTHGNTVWMQFDNGGRLLPTDGKRVCTVA